MNNSIEYLFITFCDFYTWTDILVSIKYEKFTQHLCDSLSLNLQSRLYFFLQKTLIKNVIHVLL